MTDINALKADFLRRNWRSAGDEHAVGLLGAFARELEAALPAAAPAPAAFVEADVEGDALPQQLRGRALYLREQGGVKSADLMDRAADALEAALAAAAELAVAASKPVDLQAMAEAAGFSLVPLAAGSPPPAPAPADAPPPAPPAPAPAPAQQTGKKRR